MSILNLLFIILTQFKTVPTLNNLKELLEQIHIILRINKYISMKTF